MVFPVLCISLLGLILGSFFNVLVWRIPRGESIVTPASHCPGCNRALRWFENIPVASFLFLRGRCSGCNVRIPIRYPLVECGTALGAVLLWHELLQPLMDTGTAVYGELTHAVLLSLVLLLLIPLSLIDIDHFLLPFPFTIPILAGGVVAALLPQGRPPVDMLLGIAAGAGPLLLIGYLAGMLLKKEAMGGGDIWLMAGLGAWVGWRNALLTLMFGSVLGATVSLVCIPLGLIRKDHVIPFGPFLSAGAWIAVLWGKTILDWYLGLLVLPHLH